MDKRDMITCMKSAAEEAEQVAEEIKNKTDEHTPAQAFVEATADHARHSIQYIRELDDEEVSDG